MRVQEVTMAHVFLILIMCPTDKTTFSFQYSMVVSCQYHSNKSKEINTIHRFALTILKMLKLPSFTVSYSCIAIFHISTVWYGMHTPIEERQFITHSTQVSSKINHPVTLFHFYKESNIYSLCSVPYMIESFKDIHSLRSKPVLKWKIHAENSVSTLNIHEFSLQI